MPQVRLETSRRVCDAFDSAPLFAALHPMLVEKVKATLEACKSRVAVIEQTHIAEGSADRDMMHLEIGLIAGRTPEAKKDLGTAVLALLRDHAAAVEAKTGLRISTTVRLVDMDPIGYFK